MRISCATPTFSTGRQPACCTELYYKWNEKDSGLRVRLGKSKCNSKKCACRDTGQLCNSKCHSSLSCSNK
ncbi:hypothetical protein ANTPLA_LOCUS9453 [Anthophora plagiata]